MPRPKGSRNKSTLAKEKFLRDVEATLERSGEEGLINLTCRHLTNKKIPMISFAALKHILEMKFPKQQEITGPDGGAIVVKVTHVGN